MAADLAHLGFTPAAPTSFGRPLPLAAADAHRGRGRGMTRIVLVGGGYVTIHAYAAIARRLRRPMARGEVEVVVVTADPCHSFHGFTGEVLAGILPFERTRTPVAEACPRARVVHARVTGVDRDRHTVTYVPVTGGPAVDLRWDHLVIGTGSREPAARGPRACRGTAYLLRAPGDIERLAARVASLRPGPADPVPTVVVAGGGVAGVELAAAVADRGQGLVRVELVHSGEHARAGARGRPAPPGPAGGRRARPARRRRAPGHPARRGDARDGRAVHRPGRGDHHRRRHHRAAPGAAARPR